MLIKTNPIPENVETAIKEFFANVKPLEDLDVQDLLYWLLVRESERMTAEKMIEEELKEENDEQG